MSRNLRCFCLKPISYSWLSNDWFKCTNIWLRNSSIIWVVIHKTNGMNILGDIVGLFPAVLTLLPFLPSLCMGSYSMSSKGILDVNGWYLFTVGDAISSCDNWFSYIWLAPCSSIVLCEYWYLVGKLLLLDENIRVIIFAHFWRLSLEFTLNALIFDFVLRATGQCTRGCSRLRNAFSSSILPLSKCPF